MTDRVLAKYGKSLKLYDENGTLLHTGTGILQAMNVSDTASLREMTPGGAVQKEKYLLIAGEDAFAGAGAERVAEVGGKRYAVLRADRLDAVAGLAHWEAVLCPEGRRLV